MRPWESSHSDLRVDQHDFQSATKIYEVILKLEISDHSLVESSVIWTILLQYNS